MSLSLSEKENPHVRASFVVAVAGVMLTLDADGILLEMVRGLEETGAPLSLPSKGMTVQITSSPLLKKAETKVLLTVRAIFPLIVQA